MARIIAVTNMKGGTAKTSTVTALAAAYGALGRKALVVDMDPQGNASTALNVKDDGDGLLQVMTGEGNLRDLIQQTSAPGVDLIPGGLAMNGLDAALAAMPEKALARAPAFILKPRLAPLAKSYGLILIDNPPNLGTIVWNSLVAATETIIPVELHGYGTEAASRMLDVVEEAKQLNHDLSQIYIVPCRVNMQTRLAQGTLEAFKERWGSMVTESYIRNSIRVAEAPLMGQTVITYSPNSPGSEDYRSLLREILSEGSALNGQWNRPESDQGPGAESGRGSGGEAAHQEGHPKEEETRKAFGSGDGA